MIIIFFFVKNILVYFVQHCDESQKFHIVEKKKIFRII